MEIPINLNQFLPKHLWISSHGELHHIDCTDYIKPVNLSFEELLIFHFDLIKTTYLNYIGVVEMNSQSTHLKDPFGITMLCKKPKRIEFGKFLETLGEDSTIYREHISLVMGINPWRKIYAD